MSTNSNTLQERMAEARAVAEATIVCRILGDTTLEPSTKRLVRSRPQRIERWTQLAELAQREVAGLQALAKQAPRAKREPAKRSATTSGVYTAEMPDERRVNREAPTATTAQPAQPAAA